MYAMKNVLAIFIAAFVMSSCSVLSNGVSAVETQRTTESQTVAEKLISLINEYTDKINAVQSVYDMFFVSEKCYKDKVNFEKEYADELSAFKDSLTEEAQKSFEDAVKNAMTEFEAAVNKKAKELAGEQETVADEK